jgi:hypothetical protein
MRKPDITKVPPLEISFPLHAVSGLPNCGEVATIQNRGRLPRITQVLSLAIEIEDILRRGDAKDYADVARLSGLCRERISQVVRLNSLAPSIQVEVLYLPPAPTVRYPISETALRKIASLLCWNIQREEWARLKQLLGLV